MSHVDALSRSIIVIEENSFESNLIISQNRDTKEAMSVLEEHFRNYSRPKTIISDHGSCFTSEEFKSFMLGNNIEHVPIATASPKANGQVERVNRTLGPMLGTGIKCCQKLSLP